MTSIIWTQISMSSIALTLELVQSLGLLQGIKVAGNYFRKKKKNGSEKFLLIWCHGLCHWGPWVWVGTRNRVGLYSHGLMEAVAIGLKLSQNCDQNPGAGYGHPFLRTAVLAASPQPPPPTWWWCWQNHRTVNAAKIFQQSCPIQWQTLTLNEVKLTKLFGTEMGWETSRQ